MDKLKPILTHKFWIIGILALLIPLVGWWMDTAGLAERIDARTTTLDALNPASLVGPTTPNAEYVTALKAVNDIQTKRQRELEKKLFAQQNEHRFWPSQVTDTMVGLKFRDPVDNNTRQRYRQAYLDHFRKFVVESTISPFIPADGLRYKSDVGLIAVGSTPTPGYYYPTIHRVDAEKEWEGRPPTSQELWDAQEDLWLVKSLLDAIAEMNRNATRITEAPIRQIEVLTLRGGSRKPETPTDPNAVTDPNAMPAEGVDGGPGGPGGAGGAIDFDFGGSGPGGGGGPFGMGPGEGGGSGFGGQTSGAGFAAELDKDFGPDVVQAAATGGEGMDPTGGSQMGMPTAPAPGGMGMVDGPGGSGGQPGQQKRRYVDDDPNLPYKTRGFYLEVRMRHEELPRFQAALVSLPWPTTLLRVQTVSMYHDFAPVQIAGGGGFGGGMERGFGGGPPGGAFQRNSRPGFVPGGRGFGPGADGPGGGGIGGIGGGGGAIVLGNEGNTQQERTLDVALRDPYMAHVAIAGLMTIYKSPEIDEQAIEENAEAEAAAEAATTPDGTKEPAPKDATEGTPTPMDTPTGNSPQTPAEAPTTPAAPPAGTQTPASPPGETTTPPASPPAANANGTTPASPAGGTPPN